MKIAIVHDYLNQCGGAELVVASLHKMFPGAPIYTLLVDFDKLWPELKDANIKPSFVQRFSLVRRYFKHFYWLYPFTIRALRINGYDVVISSSSAYAKAVRIGPSSNGNRAIHICYCHTPMRFAWDFDRYIENETRSKWLKAVARWTTPFLRRWDVATARNVDVFIANSTAVQDRIYRTYSRRAELIYPPVNLTTTEYRHEQGYFLVVSRLVSYKRIDLAVQACTAANVKLIVIGDGPDRKRLESLAGNNVSFLGFLPTEEKLRYIAGCTALIFPGEEDFGITPLECNAAGKPVVAYKAGGALDTVIDGETGVFFETQDIDSLVSAIGRVSTIQWDAFRIQSHASRYSQKLFVERFKKVMSCALSDVGKDGLLQR